MIKYKIKRKIMDYEKIESVTSHDRYPPPLPLSQTHTFSDPLPLWSVTYFIDGPRDVEWSRCVIVLIRTRVGQCLLVNWSVMWEDDVSRIWTLFSAEIDRKPVCSCRLAIVMWSRCMSDVIDDSNNHEGRWSADEKSTVDRPVRIELQ